MRSFKFELRMGMGGMRIGNFTISVTALKKKRNCSHIFYVYLVMYSSSRLNLVTLSCGGTRKLITTSIEPITVVIPGLPGETIVDFEFLFLS